MSAKRGGRQPAKQRTNLPAKANNAPALDSAAVEEARLIEQLEVTVQSQSWKGPLPPPALLREYELVVPGSAERILRMAETPLEMARDQQGHRHGLEDRVIKSDIRRSWAGMVLGALLCAGIAGGGIWLLSEGQSLVGLAAVIAPLATLAGAFYKNQRSRTDEVEEKRPAPRQPQRKKTRRR